MNGDKRNHVNTSVAPTMYDEFVIPLPRNRI